MKKMIPLILLVVFFFFGFRLYSTGAVSPVVLVGVSAAVLFLSLFLRPKNAGVQADPKFITDAMGDYGKDAFTDDSQISKDYQSAVNDFLTGKPKAAMAKLEKLAPQCTGDAQRYAVAIVKALIYSKENRHDRAIVEYNRAVVINPSSHLTIAIGACHQRLGELDKAIDSYEFALELDPRNIQARSALATACVANGDYDFALDNAELALELDANHASSLATCAICHGLLGQPTLREEYTAKAEAQGYSRKKIDETIKALK